MGNPVKKFLKTWRNIFKFSSRIKVQSEPFKGTNTPVYRCHLKAQNILGVWTFPGRLIKCCCGLLETVKVKNPTSGWQPAVSPPNQVELVREEGREDFLGMAAKDLVIMLPSRKATPGSDRETRTAVLVVLKWLRGGWEEGMKERGQKRGGTSGGQEGEMQGWRWSSKVVSGGEKERGMVGERVVDDTGRWANRPAHLTLPITTATVN